MTDIFLEVFRAAMIGVIVWVLFRKQHHTDLSQIDGWRNLTAGFVFIFFGALIDITDNFQSLNHLVIIGDTPAQALLEKVVGYSFGFTLLAFGVIKWLPKIIEKHELTIKNLQQANKELKVLSGLLPICASCKKIRNEAEFWMEIEAYIQAHSEAEFTHGICPECTKKLYPEFT